MSRLDIFLIVLSTLLCVSIVSGSVLYQYVTLDWDWDTDGMKQEYLASGDYDPQLCHFSGIQYDPFYNDLFVTVPRLKAAKGVPAGLNIITTSSLLKPFPDWESNKLGNCSALQLPMSTAIDPRQHHIYVIDVGRVGVTTDHPSNLCPPKLVVYNIISGQLLRSHVLPDSVVSHSTNFLNDLVLDYVDPDQTSHVKFVYISDTKGEQIVVFDLATNETWSYNHISMRSDVDSIIPINGVNYSWPYGINGIAISPSFDYVYYSALGSKKLWQIPTWVLRKNNSDFSQNVRYIGDKVSNSDAMVFGKKGLYYGALSKNAIYMWNAEKDVLDQSVAEGDVRVVTQRPILQNWDTIQWPDGITLGTESGNDYLFFVSARAQLFHSNTLDFSGGQGPNFRIFRIPIQDKNGLYASTSDDTLPLTVIG